jgi:hypothetical protein
VNGVQGFGEDRVEEADGDGKGGGGPFEGRYGFALFEVNGGGGGAKEDLWPYYGDVVLT